jgi:hypothetical protein
VPSLQSVFAGHYSPGVGGAKIHDIGLYAACSHRFRPAIKKRQRPLRRAYTNATTDRPTFSRHRSSASRPLDCSKPAVLVRAAPASALFFCEIVATVLLYLSHSTPMTEQHSAQNAEAASPGHRYFVRQAKRRINSTPWVIQRLFYTVPS